VDRPDPIAISRARDSRRIGIDGNQRIHVGNGEPDSVEEIELEAGLTFGRDVERQLYDE
jgi:hypothetical protein